MIAEVLKEYFSNWHGLTPATLFFLPRVVVSIICGTILGIEREWFNKTAGMKTIMLICLGSTVFASISMYLGANSPNVDNTRIIGQIVTGIGFLGAGVILQSKMGIFGMTSAALIWFTGALGAVVGIGEYELAIMLSLLCVFFLLSYRWIEKLLSRNYKDSMPHSYQIKLDVDPTIEVYNNVQKIIKSHKAVINHSNLKKTPGSKKIDIRYTCSPKYHELVVSEIQKLEGIIYFDLNERSRVN